MVGTVAQHPPSLRYGGGKRDRRRAPSLTRIRKNTAMEDARQVTFAFKDFCAHTGAVNCLALGHKSGRVLATGGDDKKVNLWAVGKPNCILSLSGHSTSIECVRFGGSEELVCAGSQSGALKIWDLEATKIVRTLTGHKSAIRTIDFHPYGDFIGTGSLDTNIKLWDIRRKGCIFTYKGHNEAVNGLKFSPDGQWIASAGEDSMVKLWDLRAGKLLTEFAGHLGPVTDVEFHPHEFLLASASLDRTVNFWDLEKFQQVSTTDADSGPIRAITFDPTGDRLYAGCPDILRLYGWEPARTIDTLAMGWGKVADLAVANTQLIGATHHGTHVSLYVVDLRRLGSGGTTPGGTVTSPLQQHSGQIGSHGNVTLRGSTDSKASTNFKHGVSVRKSFSKDKNNAKANAEQMKTEEASDTGGEDPTEDDPPPQIANLNEFSEIFGVRRELQRTPPPDTPTHFTNNNEPVSVSGEAVPSSTVLGSSRRVSSPHNSSSPPTSLQHRPYTAQGSNSITRYPLRHSPSEPQLVLEGTAHPSLAAINHPPSPPSSLNSRPPDVTNTSRGFSTTKPDLTQHSSSFRNAPSNSPDLTRHSSVPQHYTSHSDLSSHRNNSTVTPHLMTTSQHNTRNAFNRGEYTRQHSQPQTEISYFGTPKDIYGSSQPEISYMGTPKDYNSIGSLSKFRDDFPEKGPMNAFDDSLPGRLGGLSLGGDHVVTLNAMSESEVLSYIAKGHTPMLGALVGRARLLRSAYTLWQTKDLRSALEHTLNAADQSSLIDLLKVINQRPFIWNLDIVTMLLPSVSQLLQSRHESYITVGCNALKLMLKNFGSMIKTNMHGPVHTVGVDISREERRNKCIESYNMMMSIRALVQKRQTLSGTMGHTYRELYILMQVFD